MKSHAVEAEAASRAGTQYVLSGQPTGWAAMASVVRDFDEEKVQDCKEDMDTLLVFVSKLRIRRCILLYLPIVRQAGLYSAVLSAFLLTAYSALQPDPTDALLFAMERIATQTASYTFNGVTLNATSMLPSARPTFTAAHNDIRVNVLWFASLMISLITASFAILVKQWLRGFLAVDSPSPQARLRVRHFRAPELEKWKVYEIAAALPLLLQVSLGLFFIGLCYFTASLDLSVNRTTIPLVAGWAFCFFSATFLPIFFPRCPYRTALLKTVVSGLYHKAGPYVQTWFSSLYPPSPRVVRRGMLDIPLLWLRNLLLIFITRASSNDEIAVVNDSSSDLDILLSVDVIQSNDELLGTTIREALQSAQPESLEAFRFLLTILGHRLQLKVPTSRGELRGWTPRLIDVRPLTRQGRSAILSISMDVVGQLEKPSNSGYAIASTGIQRSIAWSFTILASFAACGPLPAESHPFVKACLSTAGFELCHDLIRPATGKNQSAGRADTVILLRALTAFVPVMDVDSDSWLRCFTGIVDAQLDYLMEGAEASFPKTFAWDEAELLPWSQILVADIRSTNAMSSSIEFLLQIACSAFKISSHTGVQEPHDVYHAISLALRLQGEAYWGAQLRVDFRKYLRAVLHAALFNTVSTCNVMEVLLSAQDKWLSHDSQNTSDGASPFVAFST